MLSVYNQENIVSAQQNVAANKPLNQQSSLLNSTNVHTKPMFPSAKTPYKARHDENQILQTTKAGKNATVFATPAPRTTARPALGQKTTNAKAVMRNHMQTPSFDAELKQPAPSTKRLSSSRPAIKKKIHVAAEPVVRQAHSEDSDSEVESQYCPPPAIPLADTPLDFPEGFDHTYSCLAPENLCQGVGRIYFGSPKDDDGMSIRLKQQEKAAQESLDHDLANLDTVSSPEPLFEDPDALVAAIISAGPRKGKTTSHSTSRIHSRQPSTLNSRAAAAALAERKDARSHHRLPSVATRETLASKSKRKQIPSFAVPRDDEPSTDTSKPVPVSRSTIGFPKARKTPSILPRSEMKFDKSVRPEGLECGDGEPGAKISPRKFLQLYGEPPLESEMWFRLMELEINDRHREDDKPETVALFDIDVDEGLDTERLGINDDNDDFQLPVD